MPSRIGALAAYQKQFPKDAAFVDGSASTRRAR